MSIQQNEGGVLLRNPRDDEGYVIHDLIKRSPPLDTNSIYCYYLLTRHFHKTCVLAEVDENVIGFISAYRIPERPDTLFVWQVVVDAGQRGRGIGRMMIEDLLGRPECEGVRYLETTVGPTNKASRKLFLAYAKRRGTSVDEQLFLPASAFGDGDHESEMLLRIPTGV